MIRAFLTILSNALKEFSNVTPEYYFRLADWTHYACAIAKALGIPQKEFMGAYAGKVQLQHEEAINASPIATVLLAYCKDVLKNKEKAVWEGTATQLLGDLVEKARPLKSESREN
ncbi:hypothetical protein E4G67_04595 [Candidatus Bathyarchaeota archaeon]|nr:MAG: hypothetical protein E4G67_04595 [Candidatus Bathyarchaeota archaeon]